MKISDLFAFLFSAAIVAFFVIPFTKDWYDLAYAFSPLLLSFIKFALLATFGEMLVMRITSGQYYAKNFGLIPKMIIWGLLGLLIYFAFVIFSKGVTALVFPAGEIDTFLKKTLNAFAISCFMNIIFAPPMMMVHHLTDRFIADHAGKFPVFQFNTLNLLKKIDWDRMWGFVYAKTIPFFWIPAHTVTFILPEKFRVLFAALLSVFLGLFLAFAKSKK